MAVIAVSGRARSGKDSFAEMLAAALNKDEHHPYVLMAYAHELKLRCQKDFDLSYDQLWGNDKEKNDLRYPKANYGFSSNPADYWSPREIMQAYGQFFRSIDYDFWVKHLFNVIEFKEYKNVIITDCRHPNEVDGVKAHKGYHIRIVRPGGEYNIHGKDHISETGLDNYKDIDILVENKGSLEDLKIKAEETAAQLRQLSGDIRKTIVRSEPSYGKKQKYDV